MSHGHKGLRKYKLMLKRTDRHRDKIIYSKYPFDDKRAFQRPKYEPWAWD